MVNGINQELVNERAEPIVLLEKDALADKIKKRDLMFLLNKSLEGIGETYGNKMLYMFYFAGLKSSKNWYINNKGWLRVNDLDPNKESTAWCAAYVSFVLKMAGSIKRNEGTLGAQDVSRTCSVSPSGSIKSFDVMIYKSVVNPSQGHVGFIFNTTNDNNEYLVGGNQGDRVTINNTSVYGKNFTKFNGGVYNNTYFDKYIEKSDAKIVIDYINGLSEGIIPLDQNNATYIRTHGANIKDPLIKENFLSLADFEDSLSLPDSPPVTQNLATKGKTKVPSTKTR